VQLTSTVRASVTGIELPEQDAAIAALGVQAIDEVGGALDRRRQVNGTAHRSAP
jgi:hypothetical protein